LARHIPGHVPVHGVAAEVLELARTSHLHVRKNV
jgi:hypothetical protein